MTKPIDHGPRSYSAHAVPFIVELRPRRWWRCSLNRRRLLGDRATSQSRAAVPWSWDWVMRAADSFWPTRRRRRATDTSTTWGTRRRQWPICWCRRGSAPARRTVLALPRLSTRHNSVLHTRCNLNPLLIRSTANIRRFGQEAWSNRGWVRAASVCQIIWLQISNYRAPDEQLPNLLVSIFLQISDVTGLMALGCLEARDYRLCALVKLIITWWQWLIDASVSLNEFWLREYFKSILNINFEGNYHFIQNVNVFVDWAVSTEMRWKIKLRETSHSECLSYDESDHFAAEVACTSVCCRIALIRD